MTPLTEASTSPPAASTDPEKNIETGVANADAEIDGDIQKPVIYTDAEPDGAAIVVAISNVWGKHGKLMVILGIAFVMIVYEFDNTTVYTYYVYAQSEFEEISSLGALVTAGSLVFSVVKPLVAKLSDVFGRGEVYIAGLILYILSYILCASSSTYGTYAAGYLFHIAGQSTVNTLNDILIADISSARMRGFAIQVSFFPFLIMPWVSAFVVQSVVGGIGWRWGIGMFAVLYPFAASFIIGTLLFYQRKAKKAGLVRPRAKRLTVYEFFSLVDGGGLFLLIAAFALLLLPITLATGTTNGWSTPYIPALVAVGAVLLIALPCYEKWVAEHPVVPVRYFKNRTIVLALLLYCFDAIAWAVTHTYLYTWAVVAHDYSVRNATFLQSTNGIMQSLSGIIVGLVMYKTRHYKWIAVIGVCIRMLGYGLMMKWRGVDTSTAELFAVQLVQGLGSGVINTVMFVAATISVPHREVAQMTALVVMSSTLASSIGSAVSGGIYTGMFKSELAKELGSTGTQTLIDTLYDSITAGIPAWGTSERESINQAYSNVLSYMTYTAFAACAPSFVFAWFLPDVTLTDSQNVVEEDGVERRE